MSDAHRQNDALLQLLDRYCAGTLDSTQREQFGRLLFEDESARAQYVRYMHLHHSLHDVALGRSEPGPVLPSMIDDHSQDVRPRSARAARYFGRETGWPARPRSFVAASLGLTLAFWAIFFAFAWPNFMRTELAVERPAPQATPEAPSVAQLIEVINVNWGGDLAEAPARGANLQKGRQLELKSGLVEIGFRSGTHTIIEGPATFVLCDENAAEITLGRLVARVPNQATGFAVTTPSGTITDLGTEFGVQVDRDGVVDVHVFEGVIEIALADNPTARQTSPAEETDAENDATKLVLTDGEIVRLARGQRLSDEVDVAACPFVRNMVNCRGIEWDGRTLLLGNLFDDPAGTSLADAMPTDMFGAIAEISDLGVDTVVDDGLSGAVNINTAGILFDFVPVGGGGSHWGTPANDCATPESNWCISTTGSREAGRPDAKHEEGIGLHPNALVTFNLDELRAAGLPQGEVTFLAKAALNDTCAGQEQGTTVNTLVLLSNDRGLLAGYVNGQQVSVEVRDGVWAFSGELPPPLDGKKNVRSAMVQVVISESAKYLTLAVTDAGDGHAHDHAVFSGAQLRAHTAGKKE